MESMTANHTVLFEAVEDFGKFSASATFFKFYIIFVLLNVIDTVDFVDAIKEYDARVRLFTFGGFFHGVNLTGEEMSKFVVMKTAL